MGQRLEPSPKREEYIKNVHNTLKQCTILYARCCENLQNMIERQLQSSNTCSTPSLMSGVTITIKDKFSKKYWNNPISYIAKSRLEEVIITKGRISKILLRLQLSARHLGARNKEYNHLSYKECMKWSNGMDQFSTLHVLVTYLYILKRTYKVGYSHIATGTLVP